MKNFNGRINMTIFEKLNTVLDTDGSIQLGFKNDTKICKAGDSLNLIDIDVSAPDEIILTFDTNLVDVEDDEWDQSKVEVLVIPDTDKYFMDNFIVISK